LACGIRYNCEELVQEFEKSVRQDGRINLQREEELDWFLSVRYTYDKITGAIGCSQEAYIDHPSLGSVQHGKCECLQDAEESKIRP